MPIKPLLLIASAAAALALPALAQQAAQPVPAPTPTPANQYPNSSIGPTVTQPSPVAASPVTDTTTGPADESAVEEVAQLDLAPPPPPIEYPGWARRDPWVVGSLDPVVHGLGADPWGAASGAFLSTLMRRMDAPIASRWAHIALRDALLARAHAPRDVNPVDWVAERAWLLLRMGEADAARILVQSVDVDKYTPRMFTVAVQVALATADPSALCPLVQPGRATSDEPIWPLADAMCAALAGDAARASQLIDQARARSGAGGVDLLLAEKVVGAGLDTRRAVDIDWTGVNELTSWRFGIATATGMEIPQRLIGSAPANVRAWQARAPMVPVEQRTAAAHAAASLGIFSNASLVEMYSLIADSTDPNDIEGSMGGRLRRAYAARTVADRLEAMRGIWDEGKTPEERHARHILTAAAASFVPPSKEQQESAADLIASMLTGGLDRQAARWSSVVDAMGGDGDAAWAMLALSGANPSVDMSSGRVESFASRDGGHRGQMLVAGLAGLGRYADPASLGVDPTPRSRWARTIAAAARNNQPGTVVLLAGIGMQTPDWRGVPPAHLYQIVRALRQVGLEYEARMIAAEALSRL